MVKLAHDLGDQEQNFHTLYGRPQAQVLPKYETPAQRAA
jgi:hypothetical protein